MGIAAVPHPAILFAFAHRASLEQNLAHPLIVRNAGRRSFIISIEITPRGTRYESLRCAGRSGC
jgi:hypothetical protein